MKVKLWGIRLRGSSRWLNLRGEFTEPCVGATPRLFRSPEDASLRCISRERYEVAEVEAHFAAEDESK